MLLTKRTAFILSWMGQLYGFETKNTGSMRNAKTNEQGNAGYNLWQSIGLHLHRLTKRLVAEASRAPGPWSQACLVPVYHCCLSDTEAFSHREYLPRPPSSRHHFQNKSLMVNNAEFYSMFASFWITTDLMVSVRPSTFQFRGHRLALFKVYK